MPELSIQQYTHSFNTYCVYILNFKTSVVIEIVFSSKIIAVKLNRLAVQLIVFVLNHIIFAFNVFIK